MHLDCCIWTNYGAHSATSAVSVVCPLDYVRDRLRREVTGFIGAIRDDYAVPWAYGYTQAAALAPFDVNSYFTSHLSF